MKVLQVVLRGLTASFKIPFAITGVQVSTPVPSYATLLGLISCCAGRYISHQDTLVGFEFASETKSTDLERFIRWDFNPKIPGKPKLNPKGPGIRKREYLINPKLNLYVSNLDLKEAFLEPKGIPTLGRSQDLAWIENIRELDIFSVKSGKIGGTLIPTRHIKSLINGFLIRLPEYIDYDPVTRLRKPVNNELFIATNSERDIRTSIDLENGLYGSNEFNNETDCIYIHDWNN